MGVPRVSVVLASTGSNWHYLGAAIDSILDQRGVEVELVVVLDSAVPGTERFLAEKYTSQLNIIESKKRRGLARSLNIGIRLASGDYVARMDDDDISLPGRLSKQVQFLREGRYDVVGSSAAVIDANGCTTGSIIRANTFDRPLTTRELYFGDLFIHPTVVMARGWARLNRYEPTWGRGQDRELWVRSYGRARYGGMRDILLHYRRPARVKSVQLDNVRSLDRLLLRNREALGLHFYPLYLRNKARHAYYHVTSELLR